MLRSVPLTVALATTLALPALAAPPPSPAPSVENERVAQRDGKRKKQKKDKKRKKGKLSDEEREALRAEVERKVQTYLTVELSSRLGLSDDKALKLGDAIGAEREAREARHQTVKAEMKKLQELVDSGAADGALQAQTQKVVAAQAQIRDQGAVLEKTASFLTAKEQAQLVLAFPEVMHDVRKLVGQAKKERRRAFRERRRER